MRQVRILIYAVMLMTIVPSSVLAQSRRMVGRVVAVRPNSSNGILFGVITKNEEKYIFTSSKSCSWIVENQQININMSVAGITIDNNNEKCSVEIERIVSAGSDQYGSGKPSPINKPPVISANGFSCKKESGLVLCDGIFPSNPEITFEARGVDVVSMLIYTPTGIHSYDSMTGCLCRSSPTKGRVDAKIKCVSRKGKTKTFKSDRDDIKRMKWCGEN